MVYFWAAPILIDFAKKMRKSNSNTMHLDWQYFFLSFSHLLNYALCKWTGLTYKWIKKRKPIQFELNEHWTFESRSRVFLRRFNFTIFCPTKFNEWKKKMLKKKKIFNCLKSWLFKRNLCVSFHLYVFHFYCVITEFIFTFCSKLYLHLKWLNVKWIEHEIRIVATVWQMTNSYGDMELTINDCLISFGSGSLFIQTMHDQIQLIFACCYWKSMKQWLHHRYVEMKVGE